MTIPVKDQVCLMPYPVNPEVLKSLKLCKELQVYIIFPPLKFHISASNNVETTMFLWHRYIFPKSTYVATNLSYSKFIFLFQINFLLCYKHAGNSTTLSNIPEKRRCRNYKLPKLQTHPEVNNINTYSIC